MQKIITAVVTIASTIILTACVNGFQQNYHPLVNTQTTPNLALLTAGATPIVTRSNNLSQDVKNAKAQGYVAIGEASFNGEQSSVNDLIDQAKAVRATMVIYSSNYTDTETLATTHYVPADSTTYTSGRAGGKNYNEVSTTTGLVPVPGVVQTRNFDQHAVFLVKSQ